ncbi:MAG: S-layer homology domain-containing protein [Oscillospiraceae bacterium]|nr:S-layer homology domain-containing protein [Oscillospiraceae bacterium]
MSAKNRISAAAVALFLLAPIIALSFSGGAVEIESVSVTLPTAESEPTNYAPVAENLNYTTYKGVTLFGEFAATDPEGEPINYRIVTQPKKGDVTVSDSTFRYVPNSKKKGKDSFTYVAVDASGNVGQEAVVNVIIERQSTDVMYGDMSGNPAEYSALRLAEDGVFVGEKVGGVYNFNPTAIVSRGEFLAMCAKIAGIEPITDVTTTGFADDPIIPVWVKPYVSAALMGGVIRGYGGEDGASVFAAAQPVSFSEAAVMLNNALQISDVRSVSFFADEALVPAWASQAAANLNACNVLGDITLNAAKPMTRADAAAILARAADLAASRKNRGGLLGWAF